MHELLMREQLLLKVHCGCIQEATTEHESKIKSPPENVEAFPALLVVI